MPSSPSSILPWLTTLLLALPVLEIISSIWLFQYIGWWIMAWYFLSAIVGMGIISAWQTASFQLMAQGLRQGQLPVAQLLWQIRWLIIALLLILPGAISDGLALIMTLATWLLPTPTMQHTTHHTDEHHTNKPSENRHGKIIEGEFSQVEPQSEPYKTQPTKPTIPPQSPPQNPK